ncbi:MAG: acyl-CoA dehydrogenase family protein [Pseudomonadales bacterium]|nr:acyl-CoA dehydrogenase family protein [Pseudomonadales bacterium]MCP5183611.1 acyl-CoA dehydrogenase family protein [Pseudomonadales bacterium]
MNFRFSDEDEKLREEIREFLRAELSADLVEAGRRCSGMFVARDVAQVWQRKLNQRGWGAVHWPVEYGGTGWTPAQLFIFREECARAGVPSILNQGSSLLAPALFAYATEEQKAMYLPKILSGEHYWCQGYSEPGSGSDLASLKTRAERDGDDYIVNGTKIWTTHAHFADHIFCLVRTNPQGKPQQGISFLLFRMDTPGVRVEPIITLAGDHEVNQVFLDNVRVPVANRVGAENQGWTVAKHLLEYERGGGGVAAGLKIALNELKAVASEGINGQAPLMADTLFAKRLRQLEVNFQALEFMELANLARLVSGEHPGSGASSQFKIASVDVEQTINTLRLEAVDYYAVPNHTLVSLNEHAGERIGPAPAEMAGADYLSSRAASIYGGSHQVQRNIIAKAVLGL